MKPLRARSIRIRLLLLVLAAVLPAMAIVSYSGYELRKNVVRDAENYALRQVQAMAAHHERVVDDARLLLLTLARASEVRGLDAAACQVLLPVRAAFNLFHAASPNLGLILGLALAIFGAWLAYNALVQALGAAERKARIAAIVLAVLALAGMLS